MPRWFVTVLLCLAPCPCRESVPAAPLAVEEKGKGFGVTQDKKAAAKPPQQQQQQLTNKVGRPGPSLPKVTERSQSSTQV